MYVVPSPSYWHLANKGPNQHIHHKKGNSSFSCNYIKFSIGQWQILIQEILLWGKKQLKLKINEGYRIQIFESTVSSIARAEAKRFQNILGDSVYIDFEAPLYKLRIGNFAERKKAERAIESIQRLGAKDSWIVRTKINLE